MPSPTSPPRSRARGADVHARRTGGGGRSGAPDHAADAAICVAAAARTHRSRDLGQARKPHPDRRLQGARRVDVSRCARDIGPQGRRPDLGDARQSRPIHRLCRWTLRHSRDDRRAATATIPRRMPPCRRSAPNWSSTARISTRRARKRSGLAETARIGTRPFVRCQARRRRRDLRARIVPRRARSRHRLCPDRHGVRHLRHDFGARSAGAEDTRSSASAPPMRRPMPCPSPPAVPWRPIPRQPSPMGWRRANRILRPSKSSAKARMPF